MPYSPKHKQNTRLKIVESARVQEAKSSFVMGRGASLTDLAG